MLTLLAVSIMNKELLTNQRLFFKSSQWRVLCPNHIRILHFVKYSELRVKSANDFYDTVVSTKPIASRDILKANKWSVLEKILSFNRCDQLSVILTRLRYWNQHREQFILLFLFLRAWTRFLAAIELTYYNNRPNFMQIFKPESLSYGVKL